MQVAFRVPDYVWRSCLILSFISDIQKEDIVGEKGSVEFRSYLSLNDTKLSPWHDLALVAGKSETGDYVFNFVNEITRGYGRKYD
jgi:hypothetical protein